MKACNYYYCDKYDTEHDLNCDNWDGDNSGPTSCKNHNKDAFEDQENRETESILVPEKRCIDCKHKDEPNKNEPCLSCLPNVDMPDFEYRLTL